MNIFKELEIIRTKFNKPIVLIDGLKFSQKDQVKTIEYYTNSKYLNGQKDELGRDKPFMQILNSICDVEDTAKDLDTKDIQILSDDANHYLQSFLLSKDVYVWMKDCNFAKTLNDMRSTHTRYGSLLVKKCIYNEKGEKKLKLEIPAWKNVMNDQVDILNEPIVEVHFMSASQLNKKRKEWKNIDQVLEKIQKTGSNKKVPVYEIRGYFPRSYISDFESGNVTDPSYNDYSYQLYYIAGNPEESDKATNFQNGLVALYWEDDTEEVYKYLARKPRAGRAFGVGVMEEGEEAQVWTNDAVMKQYKASEYSTKVVGQSASRKLKGRNLINEVDDGQILEHEDGKPITTVNLVPSGGFGQFDTLINQWYDQLQKTTSAYDAQRGDTPPSGTPFRLQATLLQQSSSVFKNLQEDLGIFITEIFEDWVLPHLASKLNKEHILSYEFSPEELREIDQKFTTHEANRRAIEMVLSGKMVTQEEYDSWIEGYDQFIKQTKSQRFIEIPKDFYKNLKAKVTVNITGEQRNKAATMESLNNILTLYLSRPEASSDPVATKLLERIVELSGSGISPVAISSAINAKNKMMKDMPQEQPIEMPAEEQLSLEANPQ